MKTDSTGNAVFLIVVVTQVLAIMLKLMGLIQASWLCVLIPVIVYVAVLVVLFAVLGFVVYLLKYSRDKEKK